MKSFELTRFKQFEKWLKSSSENSLTFCFGNQTRVLLTAEHAGDALPQGYLFNSEEIKKGLPKAHWSFDPGSAEVALELGKAVGCHVVLSRLSRLFVDVNRPLTSETLFRKKCDDILVNFNQDKFLTEGEKLKRVSQYYIPYHWALRDAFLLNKPDVILSLHSFTKNYEGSERKVETGVLFSIDNTIALRSMNILRNGFYSKDKDVDIKLRLNEPWSGLSGIAFALDSIFAAYGTCQTIEKPCDALMIEFRNDLLTNEGWRSKMISEGLVPIIESSISKKKPSL